MSLMGKASIYHRYPSRDNIRKLLYKRGFGKVNGQRLPISNNSVIEQSLGKHGIVCIEDLINEIVTCGPHFKEANNFIWPFKLRAPRGGFRAKRHPFQRGGDWGNRQELINPVIKNAL
jgi:large subunit ribosomal protein L7e